MANRNTSAITVLVLTSACGGISLPNQQAPADAALLTGTSTLPALPQNQPQPGRNDWLIDGARSRAGAYRSADGKEVVLDNGLIRRSFRLTPNCATVGFENRMTDAAMIREQEGRVQRYRLDRACR